MVKIEFDKFEVEGEYPFKGFRFEIPSDTDGMAGALFSIQEWLVIQN